MSLEIEQSFLAVCYEQIQDQYYYGLFGDFRLIIDTNNGYFNATKLCAEDGKQLFHWLQNRQSQELIKYLGKTKAAQNSNDPLFINKRGGKKDEKTILSGTYLPQELILSVALWISNEFYIKVNKIITDYYVGEFNEKYKNNTEQLKQKVNEIECRMNHLESQNSHLQSEKDHLESENKLLESLLRQIRVQTERFQDDVAPKTRRAGILNTLVVLRKNAKDEPYPYYVVRCQRHTVRETTRKLRRRYPDLEIAYQVRYNPNAMNLFNRMKEEMPYIAFKANHLRVSNFKQFESDLEDLIPKLV